MNAVMIYDGSKLMVPSSIVPKEHHLRSSDLDNLMEIASRTCYDSFNTERSRSSEDLHKHLCEVNHGSVQEHANITVEFIFNQNNAGLWYSAATRLAGMPGISVAKGNSPQVDEFAVRLTANIRVIREWMNYATNLADDDAHELDEDDPFVVMGRRMQSIAFMLAPLSMVGVKFEDHYAGKTFGFRKVDAVHDNEIWVSFLISGVSRGLTHELVRHKWQTAVSQRSTRYVDESESEWCWHPLIAELVPESLDKLGELKEECSQVYDQLVSDLEARLIDRGTDRFTARKQARGAARGVLGNALSSDLVFSASLTQWKRMIKQRCTNAADAEIRLMMNDIALRIGIRFPHITMELGGTEPSKDGIGWALKE